MSARHVDTSAVSRVWVSADEWYALRFHGRLPGRGPERGIPGM
ncbi:MAG: hypothetical protein ACUVSW_09610 [Roseiflexus sp.]